MSETDSAKKRSGSEGEVDDGRRCRQSGRSGGDEEKASGDRQKAASLGMPDGGVDGKDESVGHKFRSISVCCTRNRHSPVNFTTSYCCGPACCPIDSVRSSRSSRRQSQGGSDWDGC